MTGHKKKLPRWAWILIKLAIAAAVVLLMFRKGLIHLEKADLAAALANWRVLLYALAVLLLGVLLQSVRWGLLLRPHGIRLRLLDLFMLMMTGQFFTLIAPGGIGGDAVKAYYVTRGRTKKTEAAITVFLDRFLGLATMLLVATVMVALTLRDLWHRRVDHLNWFGQPGGRVLVLLIAAAAIVTAALALLVMSRRLRQTGLLSWASRALPFRGLLLRTYRALHLYRDHPGSLAAALAVSVAAQIPLYLSYYLYGIAVGAHIEPWHCALIVPPAMVIRVLPLSLGGAGQGFIAMSLLFPLVGVTKGAAIGAVGDAMYFVLYLVSGLFFLFGHTSYHEFRKAADQAAEENTTPPQEPPAP